MTDAELLNEVKTRLAITGSFHDNALLGLISDTKEYLKSAGVADDSASVGVICRGVADLWNMGSGEGQFSRIFYERATQLALEGAKNEQS